MWRNYLAVGLRAMAKNKAYAFINIFGLAVGMAACLMLLLYVRYELSYDKWLPDADRTAQVQVWFPNPDNGQPAFVQAAPYISGPALAKDFPQIERQVFVLPSVPVFVKDGQPFPTEDYWYVGDNILDVLRFPMVAGTPETLDQPGSAVMTEEEAMRRFGSTDVLGRTFTLISKGISRDYRVGGVLKDLPKNSHMKVSAIIRVDMPSYMAKEPQFFDCWGCQAGPIYVRFKPGTDVAALDAQLPAWEKRNVPDQDFGGTVFNAGDDADWHFVNVQDVHLGKAQLGAMTPGNDRTTIVTFTAIALLILGIAVVNFTNLTTARASQRAREVALRKVLGADRRQLVIQFIGESVIMTGIAMVLAIAMLELALPSIAAFLDSGIELNYFGEGGVVLPIVGLVLLVGIVGGAYPAFFLSRFQPSQVLKANKSSADTPGSRNLRSALVVVQFAVSIGLIICTAIIYGQTVYARSADPGYNRENILQLDGLNRYQLIGQGESIAERMRRVPGVTAVGRTSFEIGGEGDNNTGVMVPGRAEPVTIGIASVDEGFLDALGMKLVAGRWYDPNRPMDDSTLPFPLTPEAQTAFATRGTNVVINELAAKQLGYDDPAKIVGKTFRAALVEEEFGVVPITVVGVVNNARFQSVRVPLDPMIFLNGDTGHVMLMMRYRGDPSTVRAAAEEAWRSITTEVPFEAEFSEDIIQELYEADDARATAFAAFALLSVMLGCAGLFGLAAFTAERRTKEIGIRKVLGARTQDIVRLLVWQFSKPVVIANLIAWPVAWWLMRDWLNGFDDRIGLTPTPFVIAGLVAFAIAIGTVAGHALRVARTNPVHALRYE
jgi:putative ABC transport system permease protein